MFLGLRAGNDVVGYPELMLNFLCAPPFLVQLCMRILDQYCYGFVLKGLGWFVLNRVWKIMLSFSNGVAASGFAVDFGTGFFNPLLRIVANCRECIAEVITSVVTDIEETHCRPLLE